MLNHLEVLVGLNLCDMHAVTNDLIDKRTTLFVSACKASIDKYEVFVKKLSNRLIVMDSITTQYESIIAKIDRELQKGGTVTVFCETGRQRSATVIVAYLIQFVGVSFETAVMCLSSKDPTGNIFLDGCVYSKMLRNLENRLNEKKVTDGLTTYSRS
jgi:protein-tyrosine phosphatase